MAKEDDGLAGLVDLVDQVAASLEGRIDALEEEVSGLRQELAHASLVPGSDVVDTGGPTGEAGPLFGELIPSGDPQWYQGFRSPHYKQTHYDFRAKCRAFVEQEIDPHVDDWERYAFFETGSGPAPEKQVDPGALLKASAQWGLLPATMGGEWPAAHTQTPAPPDYDLFHAQILIEELGRPSSVSAAAPLVSSFEEAQRRRLHRRSPPSS